ncbi:hypothetical protein CLAFUW4_09506 [Fulvia fulva]|uniref:F-box domain-containing protein n=1 Tax=Passalora fulva TaxID=5499 RepID=A0A9Q8UT70_PASFU|nr:uncharacterized protein CLAFUR5_09603 [Fulvia fulva]KAK4613411.1 hypothetical protein CLAFUR4_09512 [Fulvia fulva]KAK4614258.1 hypothetical protein CLAFUR0_09503 [Fulvia fulva]UJO21594.1 hypothetical protein CLAFUR5_09603 [Fulvia fulva]WPV20729.1 hypothetical protein CLAFUW4_09506 [Fulvia fulva]WPV35379.1 hypothetical protein CLAFUW7_09507 [Fulvia fulva]
MTPQTTPIPANMDPMLEGTLTSPSLCDTCTPTTLASSKNDLTQDSTTSAHEQVLNTYELLERILAHLPLKKLFTIQRVSRQWHGLMARSIPIRRKMFLQAASGPHQPQDVQGFLSYIGRPLFNPRTDVRVYHFRDSDYDFHDGGFGTFAKMRVEAEFMRKGDTLSIPMSSIGTTPCYGDVQPSWRKMLLMQPPATAMSVGTWGDDLVWDHVASEDAVATIWNPRGLTFADLEDVPETFKRQEKRFPMASMETDRFTLVFGEEVQKSDGHAHVSSVFEECSRTPDRGELCKCLRMLLEP